MHIKAKSGPDVASPRALKEGFAAPLIVEYRVDACGR
jgi:hypothetical protein